VPVGTSLSVVFHVRNVSDKPISFVSETARQGDTVLVLTPQGEQVEVKDVWFSGEPIDVAWQLQPGEIAELPVLAPAINSIDQPGKYSVRYTVRFDSRVQRDESGKVIFPRPGDYDKELNTADTPLYLRETPREIAANERSSSTTPPGRTSPASNPTAQTPFRLPDHWIVEDVHFVGDDKELMTVSIQGGVNVRRWDVEGRKLLSEIKLTSDQHARSVRQDTIKLSADGSRVIAATDDYVGVWNAATGDLVKQLPIPRKQWEYDCVRCLDCSPDGRVIVAGLATSYSRTTLIYDSHGIAWNAVSGEVLCTFDDPGGFDLCDIAVSADGKQFATCSEGHRVCLREMNSGKLLRDFSEEAVNWQSPDSELIKNNVVRGIALSPDSRQLAVAGTFGVKLVDVTTGKLQRTIDAPYRYGQADVVFSADGVLLARFGAERSREAGYTIPIWSTQSGEERFEIAAPANVVAFSPDGQLLAIGDSDFYEAVSIWSLSGHVKQGPLPPPIKYSRVDRVEENTHMRGRGAEELVDRWKPVWGNAQYGLQYGIALTAARSQFRVGERVLMAAFLRNVSDKPLQFDCRPDMFGNLPRITSADGKAIELTRRNLLGAVAHYRDKLEPGENFGPLYLSVGLGENPRPGQQNWSPYWSTPAPGRYQLTHTISFNVAAPTATGDASPPDWQAGEVTSGTLGFEVVEHEKEHEKGVRTRFPDYDWLVWERRGVASASLR
jgi:WD40 repeat protein